MQRLVRVSAIIMLVLGVTGLAFGIVLLASASSIHDQTVEELEKDGSPTSIGELRDLREDLSAQRRAFFANPNFTYPYNPADPLQQTGFNMLVMEKGVGISLTNLSRAMMYQYAGIGILVVGLGLATAGVVQYKMAGRMT
jgi:hypothetical protein